MTSTMGNSGRVLTGELKEGKIPDTMGTKSDYLDTFHQCEG
jgi:hypothetical protein